MINTEWDMEVNAARYCVLKCCGCNHASAFTDHYLMEPVTLERDLNYIKDMIRVKLFMCQGGEALIHPQVTDLVRIMAASGVSNQTGILTNGVLLPKMKDSFWQTLSSCKAQLRISIYPDLNPEVPVMAERKCKEYGIPFFPRKVAYFTKPFGSFPNGESFYGCAWSHCLTVHEGYFYRCPQSAFFPKQFMKLPETIDGLPLKNLTEECLHTFLHQDKPLVSCRMCAGDRGEKIPWHQVKKEEDWNVASGLSFDPTL